MASSFGRRMWRAIKLDPAVYNEVALDTTATRSAVWVVVLAGVAIGLGSNQLIGMPTDAGVLGFVAINASRFLMGLMIWAGLINLIGGRLLPQLHTRADYYEVLRALGFAFSPGILGCLGALPWVGSWLLLLALLWMIVAMVVAVRQVLNYTSTGRAIAVVSIGLIFNAAMFGILSASLQPAAA